MKLKNCEALKKIIDETGAKLVISSTWRMAGMIEMVNMWKHRNLASKQNSPAGDSRNNAAELIS